MNVKHGIDAQTIKGYNKLDLWRRHK